MKNRKLNPCVVALAAALQIGKVFIEMEAEEIDSETPE